jgi:transglutaminase-like putative cysteine protease
MMGVHQEMQVFMKRLYSAKGDLLAIDQAIKDQNGEQRFTVRVEGETMTVTTDVSGRKSEKKLPKPKESLRDALKSMELAGKNGKVGAQLSYSMFEPMYQREIEGTSTVEAVEERVLDGVKTKVYQIKSVVPSMGIESVSYVAESGKTLEDRVAGIITSRLEPKEVAQDITYINDVIVSNAAAADKPIDNARERPEVRLRLFGPLNTGHFFNEERQQFAPQPDGADFTGKRISLEGFKAAQLPIKNDDVAEWQKPSLLVQSEDPRLIAKAKEIAGDEKDAFAVSTKLCHWVKANVRTTYSARLSNSLEVLEHPEGDCTEHSMLFIGLARAAGLPAREAAGLIYMNEGKPAFYFHQWASVWVGKWIDVDPTFDQPLADATHIKLAMGDLFEQAKLIPTIGKIRISVIE